MIRGVSEMDKICSGVDPTDTHVHAKCKEEPVEPVKGSLPQGAHSVFTMVINPKICRQYNRKRRKAYSTSNGSHPTENGDALREDKCDSSKPPYSAQPSSPVNEGVGLEMLRFAQNFDEDKFGTEMQVDSTRNDQANKSNSIGDFLDGSAGATE